ATPTRRTRLAPTKRTTQATTARAARPPRPTRTLHERQQTTRDLRNAAEPQSASDHRTRILDAVRAADRGDAVCPGDRRVGQQGDAEDVSGREYPATNRRTRRGRRHRVHQDDRAVPDQGEERGRDEPDPAR